MHEEVENGLTLEILRPFLAQVAETLHWVGAKPKMTLKFPDGSTQNPDIRELFRGVVPAQTVDFDTLLHPGVLGCLFLALRLGLLFSGMPDEVFNILQQEIMATPIQAPRVAKRARGAYYPVAGPAEPVPPARVESVERASAATVGGPALPNPAEPAEPASAASVAGPAEPVKPAEPASAATVAGPALPPAPVESVEPASAATVAGPALPNPAEPVEPASAASVAGPALPPAPITFMSFDEATMMLLDVAMDPMVALDLVQQPLGPAPAPAPAAAPVPQASRSSLEIHMETIFQFHKIAGLRVPPFSDPLTVIAPCIMALEGLYGIDGPSATVCQSLEAIQTGELTALQQFLSFGRIVGFQIDPAETYIRNLELLGACLGLKPNSSGSVLENAIALKKNIEEYMLPTGSLRSAVSAIQSFCSIGNISIIDTLRIASPMLGYPDPDVRPAAELDEDGAIHCVQFFYRRVKEIKNTLLLVAHKLGIAGESETAVMIRLCASALGMTWPNPTGNLHDQVSALVVAVYE